MKLHISPLSSGKKKTPLVRESNVSAPGFELLPLRFLLLLLHTLLVLAMT